MKMSALPDSFLRRMEKKDKPPGNAGLTSAEAQEKWARGQEKQLQNQCASLCRQRGLFFLQAPFGRKSGLPAGWPDFCIWVRPVPGFTPRIIMIECKAGNEKQTPDQIKFAEDYWNKTDCEVKVVYNLEQFRALIS
jgi:hypothetical protein